MAEDYPHQRRFPRIPSSYIVLVRKVGEEDIEELAKTRSLSLGGCSFRSDEPLGEGAGLELVISLALRPLSIPARVAWEHPHDDGGFEVGVEFLKLDHDERKVLEHFFNRDLREMHGVDESETD
jgi:hypothetical protein